MKPLLNRIDAFDASEGTTITFSCGNQIFGSKVTIYDPKYKNCVSDLPIVPSMRTQYVIPPDTTGLENGKEYELVLTIYEDHLFSEDHAYRSDSSLFSCYTRPAFSISPITLSSGYYTIKNPSLSLSIDYQQIEEEPLDMYYIKFYDENQKELSDSGELYGSNGTQNIFSVNGLMNKTFYYFRAFGRTRHGMELDTGFQKVFTSFIEYESSSNLRLKNDYRSGEVIGEVYLNVILYSSDKPVTFENNTTANLKDNTLRYDSGLRIGETFSMYTEVEDINPDTCFLRLTDPYGNAIDFYYDVYKKYAVDEIHQNDETFSWGSDNMIVEYKPYFSVDIGAQRYVTGFFSSASSPSELSKKRYSISMSKHRDMIKLNIREQIS